MNETPQLIGSAAAPTQAPPLPRGGFPPRTSRGAGLRGSRSFTLAEVLVALLVTAVVIPVALRALLTVSALREAADQRCQAAELADLKLNDLVVTGAWSDAEDSGDFGTDHPGFTWALATASWSAGDIALRQLDLTVHGPARGGHATAVTLTTLVPEPQE